MNPLAKATSLLPDAPFLKPVKEHWDKFTSLIKYPPCIKPAVKTDKCELDTKALTKRVLVIAAIALAAIAASFALVAACGLSPLWIWPSLGLLVVLIKLDEWLSTKAVDEKAVHEYLEKDIPSASATAWIQKRPEAAKLLINKKGDLNKVNDEGCRLIEEFINPLYANGDADTFESFKLLIDHDVDLNLKDRHNFSAIERIFQSANPHYLQYIVSKKKIPKNLTLEQKFNFWFYLGHHPITKSEEFKKLNIEPNVVDSEGLTPLKKLIQLDPTLTSQNYSRGLPMDDHVVYLITDTKILKEKVNIDGKVITIRKFLLTHRKKSKPIQDLWEQIKKIEEAAKQKIAEQIKS